jgi:ribonuclease-3
LSDTFESVLGHRFSRPELLREALTHRSALQGSGRARGSNERLEFVGDRVLGLVMAEWLAERFPREQEGDLGRRLAQLVSQPVLAAVAESIGLDNAIAVAPGEARAGVKRRATVLADALEAAIGAIYYDGGLAEAGAFVRRAWDAPMIAQAEPPRDAKTTLQEWAQRHTRDLPAYRVVRRSGPPHAPEFVIAVQVGGLEGTGSAGSKRVAEQLAAADLLQAMAQPAGMRAAKLAHPADGGPAMAAGAAREDAGNRASGDASCGDPANGDATKKDAANGEAATGEAATREATKRDAANGEAAAGQAAAGDTAMGETAVGDTAAGETAAGDTAAGETAAGEIAAGETAVGDTATAAGMDAAGGDTGSATGRRPPPDPAASP